MKRVFLVIFQKKNVIKLVAYVLFAAVSQPLIAWSISGLSNVFVEQQIEQQTIMKEILILLVALILAWVGDNIQSDLKFSGELELRKKVFEGIYSLPVEEFEKQDSGAYYNQVARDMQMIRDNVLGQALNIMADILKICFIAILLCYCHWLSFIIIVIFLIPLVISNTMIPRKIGACRENSLQKWTEMTVKMKDVFSGFVPAKFLNGGNYVKQSMFQCFEEGIKIEKKIIKLVNLSAFITNTSVTVSQFSGMFIAFYLMINGRIDFAKFILIFQLGMIINTPVTDLINSVIDIRSFEPYINNTENWLLKDTTLKEQKLESISQVTFDNVTYIYPQKERYILKDFNFKFERGKKYLIIGESGSGKTTLTKLLLGMIHPGSGNILYDDYNQQEISPMELYHHATMVPQQVYIFMDTIRRNIDLQGKCTDEQIWEIIDKVKLRKFFEANHYTLDTQISNETLQVSGGEKARIGLARTMTLQKSIVIYDEVLAGLDKTNAEMIEELILEDTDRIVLHIAHNWAPQNLNRYDEVLRLKIQK